MTVRVKVINPRYAGATPEDVARALLRPLRTPRPGRKAVRRDEVAVEKTPADQSGGDVRHLR